MEIYEEISAFAKQMEEEAQKFHHLIPPDCDLVLEIEKRSDDALENLGYFWSYYYANHDERVLFWLEPFEVSNELDRLYGEPMPSHISESLS